MAVNNLEAPLNGCDGTLILCVPRQIDYNFVSQVDSGLYIDSELFTASADLSSKLEI